MKLTVPNWKPARITSRHWHYAGIAVLCLLSLALAVRLVMAWRSAEEGNTARLQQHEIDFRAMQLKTKPLRGLDRKIAQAQLDEAAFYQKRFPDSDSEVLRVIGALAVKNNVLLSREQYAHGKPNQGVTELRMDASLSGDYAPIVRFINDLERDKVFFLIDGIALSGQQNGIVSLRMRLTTFLREPDNGGIAPGPTNLPVAAHAARARHSTGDSHAPNPSTPSPSIRERH